MTRLVSLIDPLFPEFEYVYNGHAHYFLEYESLKNFRLKYTPSWRKPFVQMKDDFHRIGERYYEEKFNLPDHYLAGMYYCLPFRENKNRFAKRASEEYVQKKLQEFIRIALTDSMSKTSEKLIRHIIKNRKLVENKINEQVSREKACKEFEKRTQALARKSLPEGLVLDIPDGLNPHNRKIGSSLGVERFRTLAVPSQ